MSFLTQRFSSKGAARAVSTLFVLVMLVSATHAQVTTGNVRGTVKDPSGGVVPNATVTITDPRTNTSTTVQTTGEGEYQFNNLLVGDYTVTVTAPSFSKLTLSDVRVELNKTTDVPTALSVGEASATIEVSAGGAELVDTTTTNLAKQFNERQVVELAQTDSGLGVYNLALTAPNVSSSGGVGVGSGGSVGGQRPRNNNFVVDGIDNNDKGVTGPQVYISPDTISEFSLLQNQYSAEFARSTGGQFIVTTKSGTNDFHGEAYDYFRNRKLNALDTLQKNAGVVRSTSAGDNSLPRFDRNRYGFNIGGPVYLPRFGEGGKSYKSGKDKLFFFSSYEVIGIGQAGGAGAITAPTAGGLAIINSFPGFSATNLSIFNQFSPRAAANDAGSIQLCTSPRNLDTGECPNNSFVSVPIGNVSIPSPSFSNNRNFVANIDFTQSSKTQQRARFIYNRFRSIDTAASLPQFFAPAPVDSRLFSYTLTHSFSSQLTNETRLAYRRNVQVTPVGNFTFPGLDQFPNIGLGELGFDIGPDGNAPQSATENNYQVVNNLTYLAGNHSMKFGGDFRKLISPQVFVQRLRGDFQFNNLDTFLRDISPEFAERNVGGGTYYGDQRLLFLFAQDDYRVRPNLTLNLGLNYAYQQVPFSARRQDVNALSSVPGLIDFRSPRAQKKNFGPRVGFAYSPNFTSGLLGRAFGSNGKTSIRAGFSLAYDVIFDNIYILSSPPQAQQTIDVEPGQPNFLARGGIPNRGTGTSLTAAQARAATGSFIQDQQVPYAITYTGSIQRQLQKDYSVEVRYLHTRGIHLLTQNRINRQTKTFNGPGGFLPTFLSAPTQAQLDALPTTLTQINARSSFVPRFANAGFDTGNLVSFESNGNSSYDAGSVLVQRRFTRGFQGSAAYTYSHLIDDTTAEVFSTVLSPRRVQDFQNLRAERADSALDRRHRFVVSSLYELPFFNKSSNSLLRATLGGLELTGTYTAESGEKATVRSGIDTNRNGDSAGDRTIINPGGVIGTGSTVRALRNTAGGVVAYLANTPNAQYIQAGAGALANAGRNTLQLPGINNLDFSILKNIRFGEVKRIQLRSDFFNFPNHPQYTPGSVNGGESTSTTSTAITGLNTVGLSPTTFNRPNQVFSSHPRTVQFVVKFIF